MKFKRKSKTVNKNPNNSPSVTYITKDTEIKADILSKDDIRIAGTVDGEVESKQKLILNDSGKIKGTIISPVADISGKVIGDVRVANKLTLRATAIIEGKIFTKKLAIEDGAQLRGSLQVGPDTDIGTSEKTGDNKKASSSSIFKGNKSISETEEANDSKDKSGSKRDDTDSSSSSGTSKIST